MLIGLFDSGLGGLTILRAVAAELPEFDYLFYGDTAHLPYGDKTEAKIYEFSEAAMAYLFDRGCALVIIACNSASAETLRRLQDQWLPEHYPERRILGVIIPTVEVLVESGSRRAILLATKRTVDSRKYERELSLRGNGKCLLEARATPTLVPLIEDGNYDSAVTEVLAVLAHLPTIHDTSYDTLVLGCTHYTELKVPLRNHLTKQGIVVLSQDEIIPLKLREYLVQHPEITTLLTTTGTRTIHLTEHRPRYDAVAAQLLGGAYLA